MQYPESRDKTYFVTSETYDTIFSNRVDPYGRILPIGAEGFAELCRTLPSPTFVDNPHSLKAFRYLDPFKDKRTLAPPTPLEVLNLVAFGDFHYQRCLSTLPAANYVVPRQKMVNEAVHQLRDARCLLVHSWLGNGKSIFLYILAHALSEMGYRCFFAATNPTTLQRDLDLLQSFGKIAIFFDWYYGAEDVIKQLNGLLPDVKFIIAVRTAVHEARLNEITSQLPSPLRRVNLNSVTKTDISDFKNLLNQSGLQVPELEPVLKKSQNIRDIVVTLYNNEKIRRRIKKELTPVLNNVEFKKVFIVSHLLKWRGHDIDAAFLRVVTGCDAYAILAKFRETAGDMFRLDNDNIQVRSAMFAEYVITNHLSTADIVECVYEIVVESVKRKSERRYQAILSSLMRFWVLKDALVNDPDHLIAISKLFDRLHRDVYVNREPLFWLQYGILMEEDGQSDLAEKFIATAYIRAAASKGFKTFQIDTYALGLILRIEAKGESPQKVVRFEGIIRNLELVRKMIGDGNIRYQAIRVLDGILPFVSARASDFSSGETTTFMFHLALVKQSLEQLTPFERQETSADIVAAGIKRASEQLLLTAKRDATLRSFRPI